MPKFRKKPVIVEAVMWTGENLAEIRDFLNGTPWTYGIDVISIPTREGIMDANIGDYIIKEPFATDNRKFYPCKPDIFEQTYEPVADESTAYGLSCPGGKCEM